ncbi:hypothetical protein FHR90_000414 [Endobacter medicaginis]|uniref:Uncharacterized protein n=1 Tax=Endobacter medicaginis TaxID=1181271 RepID=A0A839UX15_9PROT|nr:hypothetical protein [Endobacter medicaginis]MBB3172600.1 hypothetical protein [Endobacter medicaginis]MCX5476865.1 hypothetical protein [Endobacter medicaginis]NVN29378.1 hypothetical protein [Endobacter medicaginis]
MNPRIVRDIDAALRQGVAIGDEDYYDTDIERRARAYAAYAVTRDMGMYYEKPLREHTPQGAFEMVYTGNFGNMIVGSGDEVVAHWMSVGREEDEDDLWSVGY